MPERPDSASSPAPEQLARLLGDGDLQWLLRRARRRLEAGGALTGTVTLARATPGQRAAVHRLLGRAPRAGGGVSVRWEDVDAVLRVSGASPGGVAGAVEALGGPVVVRADAAAAEQAAWAAAWAPLDDLGSLPAPALGAWWAAELASGLPRRLAGTPAAAAGLARDLRAVLQRLPAAGVAIGSLAHAATGSAHALDAGPLPALALRAARVVAGLPPAARTAATDRATWAAVGVVRDELSSTVLVLGLPVEPAGASGQALAAWNAAGQPAVLTLRHLRADPPAWAAPHAAHDAGSAGGIVRSCENPVVLAAVADAVGAAVPMVCTAGQPSVAALAVLAGLREAGWAVAHHGDFDADGLRITERLVREVGASAWRMSAADYRSAVASGAGRPAAMPAVSASWDADLGPAMVEAGQVVEEEGVLAQLLADLAPHRS